MKNMSSEKRWSRVTESKRKDRRQREFVDQLRDASWTKRVMQDDIIEVCRAYTDSEWSETHRVYMHYSDNFNWWGIAIEKRRRLNAQNSQLMHAFLGRQGEEWYLFPDNKIEKLELGIQSRETDHYKVQIDHGEPPNEKILEQYSVYKGT